MKVKQLENLMTEIACMQTILEVEPDATRLAPIQKAVDALEKVIMEQLQDKVIVRRRSGIWGLPDIEEYIDEIESAAQGSENLCSYCGTPVPDSFEWHIFCKLNNLEERLKTMEEKEQ